MEKSVVLKKTQERYLDDFYLVDAGISKTEPLHGFGPTVRENFVIHIILEGQGIYLLNDQKLTLGPGAGFVIPTDRSTFYQSDAEDPWTYLWIQLNGSRVRSYLDLMGILQDTHTFKVKAVSKFVKTTLEILQYEPTGIAAELHLNAACLSFLADLADEAYYSAFPAQYVKIPEVVQTAVQYIHRHAGEQLTAGALADAIAVNRCYLSRVFHQSLGVTVKQYINEIRIFRAAELLIISDYSMEEIAYQTGFSSAKSFSEIFKKAKGRAPREYRKANGCRVKNDGFALDSVEALFESMEKSNKIGNISYNRP